MINSILKESYCAPVLANWQGRNDGLGQERFFQCITCLDLTTMALPVLTAPAYAIVGFCCDEGIRRNLGRTGAAQGPQALRTALAKLPIHAATTQFFDVGDIICVEQNLEQAQAQLAQLIALLLQHNFCPLVFGGGHETAWGHYQGIAQAGQANKLGIINFDAHFDLRPCLPGQLGSSGTPFLQIAHARQAQNLTFDYLCLGIQRTGNTASLFNTAEQLKVNYIYADDFHLHNTAQITQAIAAFVAQHDAIYLSVCLDVFASAFAPGVSAPQPAGLLPWQVVPLLQQLARCGKVISLDIVELSPPFDHDAVTAKLGALLLAEFVAMARFS